MLEVGDTIKCADADDLIKTMNELAKCDVETDMLYTKDGRPGLWLEVTQVKSPG